MKNVLNRCLNVCFMFRHSRILEFAFRLIRSFLVDFDIFSQFPSATRSMSTVFAEFNHQFKMEFGFDATQQTNLNDTFDYATEVTGVLPELLALESQFPVLQYVSFLH